MSEIVITTRGGQVRVERRVMLTLAAWSQEPDSLSVTRAASLLSCSEAQCVEAMQVLGAQRCWGMDRWETQHASRRWERVHGLNDVRRAAAAAERRVMRVRMRCDAAREKARLAEEARQEMLRLREEESVHRRAMRRRWQRDYQRARSLPPGMTSWRGLPQEERRQRVQRMLEELGDVVTWSWRDVSVRYGVPYHSAYVYWHRWQAGQNVVAMTGTRRTRCAPITT